MILYSRKGNKGNIKKISKFTKNLSNVYTISNAIIDTYLLMFYYLAKDVEIVHSPNFEYGIVKVIDEDLDKLNELEKAICSSFLSINDCGNQGNSIENLSFV